MKRVNESLESLADLSDCDNDGRLTKFELTLLLAGIIKLNLEIEMKNRGKFSCLIEQTFSFE